MKPIAPPIDIFAPIKVILICGGLVTIRMLFEQNSFSTPSPIAEFFKDAVTLIAAIFIYIKLLKPDRSAAIYEKSLKRVESQVYIRASQLRSETSDSQATYSLQDFIDDEAEKYLIAETEEEKSKIRTYFDDVLICFRFLDHLDIPIKSKRRNQVEPKSPGDIALEYTFLLDSVDPSFSPTTASDSKIVNTITALHTVHPSPTSLHLLKQATQHTCRNSK